MRGTRGGMMSLLFVELGVEISLCDPSQDSIDALLGKAEELGLSGKLKPQKNYEDLRKSLGSPKVLFFSLPHGSVGDKTVESLRPHLASGDIILDASNDHYQTRNEDRRFSTLWVFISLAWASRGVISLLVTVYRCRLVVRGKPWRVFYRF